MNTPNMHQIINPKTHRRTAISLIRLQQSCPQKIKSEGKKGGNRRAIFPSNRWLCITQDAKPLIYYTPYAQT